MVDTDKLADVAANLTQQAGEFADQVKEKLAEAFARAVPVATELATKASDAVVDGVDVAAGSLKSVTGGRISSQIDAVSSSIKGALPTSER